MADLLLELFSEEIPARMQKNALDFLRESLEKEFPGVTAKGFVTPRRLAVFMGGLPTAQADVSTELKGPKVGAPEAAIAGFLKKSGLALDQLETRDGIYIASIHKKGGSMADALKAIIEKTLAEFPWPKSMRWGNGATSWVRPLHSILCIFDGKIVPVEFAGLTAGNTTRGHRFLSPAAITVNKADEYETLLGKAYVVADREKRKANILQQAKTIAADKGLKLIEDVLEEVTGLVEWPVVLAGKIDADFMDLPKEVLVSEMRAHQKYFALENKDGSLSDTFLITSNMETNDKGAAIIAGNGRVLRARLSDGRFFWDQDRNKKLDDMAAGLASVTFHAKLGSVADKAARIKALSLVILSNAKDLKAAPEHVIRAADLCKADLVSGMVGEFADLQGTMGRYYALQQKEPQAVADAIYEHYLPLGPSSPVPTAPVSVCVALADKLDTLISMFAIGEKPTGSKDPFALRRAALGVIRIILENTIRLPLKSCFTAVPAKNIALAMSQEKLEKKAEARLHDPHKVGKYLTVNESASTELEEAVPANLTQMLYEFFIDRLIVQLKDQGIRHDVIKAVVANGDDDLVRIVARAKAVQAFLDTDDGKNLLAGYKRAANIISIEEKKDKTSYNGEVDETCLVESSEIQLVKFLRINQEKIKPLLTKEQFVDVMKILTELRRPVDHMFDKILINSEDKNLRANRLRLLSQIRSTMDTIANFSLIEGDTKEQKKAA